MTSRPRMAKRTRNDGGPATPGAGPGAVPPPGSPRARPDAVPPSGSPHARPDAVPPSGSPHARPAARPTSLSTRLLAAVIALLAVVCLVIGSITHAAMSATLTGQVDQELRFAADRAAGFLPGSGNAAPPNPLNAPGQASGTLNAVVAGTRLIVGGVLDPRTGQPQSFTNDDLQLLYSLRPSAEPTNVALSIGDYRVVTRQLGSEDNVAYLVTGLPLEGTQRTMASLSVTMLLVSGAGVLATGLIGWYIVRRALRPLERVSSVAATVAALPLEAGEVSLAQRVAPVDSRPGTEAGDVGHALNALLDNVQSALEVRQASEEKMRRFVADASHELRTPLASISGYSELVSATEHLSEDGRRAVGRILEQSRRMGSLIESLLLLARLDEGHLAAEEDVDLVLLVAEAVGDARVAGPDHRWELDLPPEPVVVKGNAEQLGRVVANLLSNARKHTDAGTSVAVSLGRSPDGGEAVLSVVDDGSGISPDFLPQIFARFTRADKARSGSDGTTGLGLPIVKAIVDAHGGRIDVASQPGRTEFRVLLPLAAAPAPPPMPSRPPRPARGPKDSGGSAGPVGA